MYDPRRIPDIGTWLVERLGQLAHFELVDQPAAQPVEAAVAASEIVVELPPAGAQAAQDGTTSPAPA